VLSPPLADPSLTEICKLIYYFGLVLWSLVLLSAATLEIFLRGNYLEKSFHEGWKASWESRTKKPIAHYKETLERQVRGLRKSTNFLGVVIVVDALLSMLFYSSRITTSLDLVWTSTLGLVSFLIPAYFAGLIFARFFQAAVDGIPKLTGGVVE